MSKLKIKIGFSDFWKDFNEEQNWFTTFLSKFYNIEISKSPDFLIYSKFSHKYLDYDGPRIFFTGENIRPNMWECDYAFSFDYNNHPRHYRLPLYGALDGLTPELLLNKKIDLKSIKKKKNKFCSFVVSNPHSSRRVEFFHKLSEYKHIDSGGKCLNNIGANVIDKISFLKDYKFTLAFENTSYPGYTTEKIFHPMLVDTIPIYWGNPLVYRDFNTKSFINRHDYTSDEDFIKKIMEIDEDDFKYFKMLKEPWFENNKLNQYVDPDNIALFFERIFTTKIKPISRTWRSSAGTLFRKYYTFRKEYW